ncbi:hypothetical protein GOODEAATRI_009627 [Goodea atripinnis]|uniref:Uncharacterized protein n=1 Tax=Goodea atripinnis TaxID=208336 RepID=A0ABV0N031_9TELE
MSHADLAVAAEKRKTADISEGLIWANTHYSIVMIPEIHNLLLTKAFNYSALYFLLCSHLLQSLNMLFKSRLTEVHKAAFHNLLHRQQLHSLNHSQKLCKLLLSPYCLSASEHTIFKVKEIGSQFLAVIGLVMD